MEGGWSPRLQSGLVNRTRISLVPVEVESRIVLCFSSHDAIPGDLGEHRGGGDRYSGRVAPDNQVGPPTPDEVPIPINENLVGLDPEPVDGSTSRQALGRRHPQFIAFGVAGVTDRPHDTPIGDPIEQRLPFLLGEHLRVTDLIDAGVIRYDGCADTERSRPGTAPNFVDSDHDPVPEAPHAALDRKVGASRFE